MNDKASKSSSEDLLAPAIEKYVASVPDFSLLREAHTAATLQLRQVRDRQVLAQAYSAANATDPKDPDTHAHLADVLDSLGLGEAAVASYAYASRLQPDNATRLIALAKAQADLALYTEAAASFTAANMLAPKDSGLRYESANCLQRAGRFEDAIAIMKELAIDYPDGAGYKIFLGMLFEEVGRHAEARAVYESASGGGAEKITGRTHLDLLAGKSDGGDSRSGWRITDISSDLLEAKQRFAAQPDDIGTSHDLARVLIQAESQSAAISVLRQALDRYGDVGETHRLLGDCFYKKRIWGKALGHYQKAQMAGYRDAGMWVNAGTAAEHSGATEDAKTFYTLGLAGDKWLAGTAYIGLARIAHQESKLHDAREYLVEARRLNPTATSLLNETWAEDLESDSRGPAGES